MKGLVLFMLFLLSCEVNIMKITSTFKEGEKIPQEYTCDGKDISPPLEIEHIPNGTKSLVLIVDDPDAPMGTWTHWVVFNIKPTNSIPEKNIPGLEALNDFKRTSYGGPCPPSGVHRYFFKLYALDRELPLSSGTTRKEVEKAMEGHVVAQAELMGVYSRK